MRTNKTLHITIRNITDLLIRPCCSSPADAPGELVTESIAKEALTSEGISLKIPQRAKDGILLEKKFRS